jgi:RNA polymerase sigma-70 factor (ECF subfamily)
MQALENARWPTRVAVALRLHSNRHWMMSTEFSDEQLIERIRAGDRESYGILATRHRQKLHRVAQRFVRDFSEVEDVVQSAHVLALRHFDQYQGPSAYGQWMASITMNQIRTRYRRNRLPVFCLEVAQAVPAAMPSPEQTASYREMRQMVDQALSRMKPAYRHVFRMRALADFSTAETGRQLGISEACVKTRLRRARLMLQDIFDVPGNRTDWVSSRKNAQPQRSADMKPRPTH